MRKIDQLLTEYGSSHKNATNKLIHWICVPLILFSLLGLVALIPWVGEAGYWYNWASVIYVLMLFYYLRLSIPLMIGFIPIGLVMLYFIGYINTLYPTITHQAMIYGGIFVAAWIVQFIGHEIEGKKPSFLKDLQFLLVGPGWLLHFVFNKLGIKY